MMRRGRDVAKGLAGLIVLLAALVGVPVALGALGQGLPSHFIGGRSLVHQLGQPLTDSALLRGVSFVAWVVWALFAAAVAIEVVAEVRYRAGRTHLTWRVPGLQGVAGSLMLTVMLLLPQRGVQPVEAITVPPPPVEHVALTVIPSPERTAPLVPPAPSDGMLPYTVQRYDSLWKVAERHLGDGLRWREIRTAGGGPLLAGQSVWVSGDEMRRPDPRTIYPGEVLLVPAATPATVMGPTEAGPAPSVPPLPAAPASTTAPDSPTVAPASSPATNPAPATTASPAPALSPPSSTQAQPVAPDEQPPTLVNLGSHHDTGESLRTLSVTLLEAGLLSASVLGMLRVLRRRQAQRRSAGQRIRLPGGAAASTELAMRSGERPDQLANVSAAVHALSASLRQGSAKVPTILGMVVSADALEVLIDVPLLPPPPWSQAAEGFRWRIALGDIPGGSWSESEPLPVLVPIGRAAGSDAEVLLNLEAAGLLSVVGESRRAVGVVRAIATSLSGAPWAGSLNVVLVGFGAELEAVDHVRSVTNLDQILGELQSTADVMRAVVGGSDPFHGRVNGQSGDGWPPTVVLCTATLAQEDVEKLAKVAEPGAGVVAVFASTTGPVGWSIDVDGNPMAVQPVRLAVEPTVLDDVDFDGIRELYRDAQSEHGSSAEDPPYDEIEVSTDRPSPSMVEPPPAVRVCVLGTVELEGAGEFKRPKSRELAVYLALHPSGVGEAELDEAMWPSTAGRLAASTRDSTVSVARTALGGPRRLLPAQMQGRDKRYQVSDEVGTDWARFCQLHRQGRATRDAAVLQDALRLVRGRPFEGVSSARTYNWVHTEGHLRQMEAEIGDAADLASSLLLADGQPVEARAAARRGLLADPYLERLWVRLMEVADALGDSQEVERIMDELDKVLELNGDFSCLHPQTLAAYQRFSRRQHLRS